MQSRNIIRPWSGQDQYVGSVHTREGKRGHRILADFLSLYQAVIWRIFLGRKDVRNLFSIHLFPSIYGFSSQLFPIKCVKFAFLWQELGLTKQGLCQVLSHLVGPVIWTSCGVRQLSYACSSSSVCWLMTGQTWTSHLCIDSLFKSQISPCFRHVFVIPLSCLSHLLSTQSVVVLFCSTASFDSRADSCWLLLYS